MTHGISYGISSVSGADHATGSFAYRLVTELPPVLQDFKLRKMKERVGWVRIVDLICFGRLCYISWIVSFFVIYCKT